MTIHCNNCNSQRESGADHPNYNSSETFARNERCGSCNRGTLSRDMGRDEIASSLFLAFAYPPLGLPLLGLKYLPRLLYGKDLETYIQSKAGISDAIRDVVPFETWWNKNLGTVISGSYPYTLGLIVHEPTVRSISEMLKKFEINSGYNRYDLSDAKNRASRLRNELNGENPVLAILLPYENISTSSLFSNPYILEQEIPTETEIVEYGEKCRCYPGCSCYHCDCNDYGRKTKYTYPNDPDKYLKPLDIVKVKCEKGTTYFHFAIYLGRNKVCHIYSDNQGAKIENWSDFLDGAKGELFRYHLPIPFKKGEDTLRHIVKATISHYKRGEYNLCNDNCEHYVGEQIIGVDYSKQAIERQFGASLFDFLRGRGNHGVKYGTSVNLQSTIRNSSQKFDNLESSENYGVKEKIKEIKGSESEGQARIEVPHEPNCKIM